jgi:DNA-directed RNA polymerase I, II, and III subunit RPABC2
MSDEEYEPDEEIEEEEEEESDDGGSDHDLPSDEEDDLPADPIALEEDEESEDVMETYKEKFTDSLRQNHLVKYHPEEIHKPFDEIYQLSLIKRDAEGIIIDENHRTYPILSKYEKTKIIGLRVAQLNKGSQPYVPLKHSTILDNSLVAEKELKEKKLPFIIMRPLFNGKCEYWNVNDLEYI